VKFSKDYVLFCHITTAIKGEKYGELLEEKGGEGFPHLVFMDEDGNVLAVHEEDRSPEAFAKTGESAKKFLSLKAKASKGDPAAKLDFLLAQMELGQLKAAEIEARLKECAAPTKEQKAKIDGLLADAAVMDIVKDIKDPASEKDAGKKCYERYKAGQPGPASDKAVQPYYILTMDAADDKKDVETFEAALKMLKDRFGKYPRAQGFFKEKDKRLEELKADKK